MEIVNNYKSYKKYLPEYADWRDKQDIQRERRLEYLKNNPDKMNENDIQRGKILLHAIDVMDEYSQSNAEDMEVATDMATQQVVGLSVMLGTFVGTGLMALKKVQKYIDKISAHNKTMGLLVGMIPTVAGMLIGTAASFPAIVWATKAQVSASRRGRFEAMNNDLKNPAIFAVLTPEQQKQVNEIAKNIELEDKDKKRIEKQKKMNFNPAESFRTLKKYYNGNDVYNEQKAEFDKQLKESEVDFDKPLSDEQIKNAKRDQQILSEMVRRIDIASQDYAENTELATNTFTTLALGTGGFVGWASNKLMRLLKINGGKIGKIIPWAVGAAIPLTMGIYAAKVQKHASRIGRFKIKQEMLNNPAELVYVDEKDTQSSEINSVTHKKKPNMFKFFKQLIKDNKEYNNYMKTEGLEELKRHKAAEQIKLTDEQLQQAKVLQRNVFKTFNKVDEKSQQYSESVEAMGEITKQGVSLFGSLAAMGVSMMTLAKLLDNPETFAKNKSFITTLTNVLKKTMLPFAFVLLPIIGIDIYTTKAQKKASRVADMLALKELEDYKHYADFSKTQTPKQDLKTPEQSNLIKRFKN